MMRDEREEAGPHPMAVDISALIASLKPGDPPVYVDSCESIICVRRGPGRARIVDGAESPAMCACGRQLMRSRYSRPAPEELLEERNPTE